MARRTTSNKNKKKLERMNERKDGKKLHCSICIEEKFFSPKYFVRCVPYIYLPHP